MLDKIVKENKLALEGIVDLKSASEIGKITGAAAVCTGTFTDMDGYIKINARMIDSKSGKITAVASVQIKKEQYIAKMIDVNYKIENTGSKEENNVSNDGNTAEDNDSELFKLLKDASDSNMSYAQFKLGTMYFNGKGVS